jgi:SH3-like domain-containing protein
MIAATALAGVLAAMAAGPALAQQNGTTVAPAAVPRPARPPAATRTPLGASGLPLPRYASLAASEVNVRTGPSTDHPIRWVYTRNGLPVRIVEEFDVWRRIEDPDGETGWAHSSLLSIRRTAMIRGQGVQELHRSPDPGTRVVLRAEPGVIGDLMECQADWCRLDVEGQRGWIARGALWGAGD